MTTGWTDDVFWPAFKAAGMLTPASVVLAGCSEPTTVDVSFREPDVETMNGAISREYEIEYQYSDLPNLAMGDQVLIADVLYRVRTNPRIDIEGGANGFFRRALLTRVS